MNHYVIYIIEVILVVYNIVTARINSNMVNDDKKNHTEGSIKHGWWGLAYIVLTVISSFIMKWNIYLIIGSFFQRKLVFDISYNYFQDRSIFFVSKNPKSIVDRIYNFIFQYNAKLYQLINLITFGILHICI
jgi:hypothetical protein